MQRLFASLLFVVAAMTQPAAAADKPASSPASKLYELRVYYASPGKLDDLHARFRNHTMKLFEKHGMTNIGYWVPVDNAEEKLIYVLSYPDMETRKKAWAAFLADPEWQKAKAESEVNGKLVAKIEEHFLATTDYSPVVKIEKSEKPRVFELRTYTTTPGNLDALNARFRDHTVKLFEKHGMTNLWYWTLTKGQKNDDLTLIYFLSHPTLEARSKAFADFGKDADWVAARKASEEKAGGSLTAKDGVKFVMLKATDYSPIK